MAKGKQSSRACDLCRLKRTKCSGTQPCSRCSAHQQECNFQHQPHESKASLRTRIKELSQAHQDSLRILDVLRTTSSESSAILRALQQKLPLAEIASALPDHDHDTRPVDDAVLESDLRSSSLLGQELPDAGPTFAASETFNASPASSMITADSLSWGMLPQGSGMTPATITSSSAIGTPFGDSSSHPLHPRLVTTGHMYEGAYYQTIPMPAIFPGQQLGSNNVDDVTRHAVDHEP